MINTLSSRILAGLTGESVQFNEVSRVILDRDFTIDPPNRSPDNAIRFVSQPLFSSVTPGSGTATTIVRVPLKLTIARKPQ